jgi:hypothetical protein
MRRVVRAARKRCPQCGERKSRDLFNKNRAQADGLQTRCRKCENGLDERKCPEPGCQIVLHGRQALCDQHQAELEATQAAARERARSRREELAVRRAADELARSSRRCEECHGPIPPERSMNARYCSPECQAGSNHRQAREARSAAREITERSCEDCRADISERATRHPLATRCEPCQAKHRTGRKRPRRKVERLCTSCGADIRWRPAAKTICTDCEPKPPRWCIDCGVVDMRGQVAFRCPECKAAKEAYDASDAGKADRSAYARQWQKANPLKVQLWDRRRWAREHGLDFEITLADLEQLWPDDNTCPVCGAGFTREHGRETNGSIDRIDNELGYVKGNVHVCCVGCNGRKSDHTVAELADGVAREHWQAWAVAYLARPRRGSSCRELWPDHRRAADAQ